jgi:3-oxoacyl-[acyl-carrier-protein] synthase II
MTAVVVTGLGVVSPLGLDRARHEARLWAGETAVAPAPADARYARHCPLVARVDGFDRRQSIANRMLRKLLTTSAAYAVVAAGEALRDGGLAAAADVVATAGLYAGSVCIDFNPEMFIPALRESLDETGKLEITRFATRGLQLIDPLFLVKTLPNGGVGGIAIEHQVTGPSLNITNGTVSGLQAIIAAARAVRDGTADVALAGGYDCMLSMDSVAEHVLAGRVTDGADVAPARAGRAFDLRRAGYALGEGAAFLLLESDERARRRGARVYGAILGAGQSTEARSAPEADDDGGALALAAAARAALGAAGRRADEVAALFGDGLGVEADDLREAGAARRVFGERRLPYAAATGNVGFTGATSGVLAVVHALCARARGTLPPAVDCAQPDPRCPFDLPRAPRPLPPGPVLVWNSEGGVKNAAVLLGAEA